MAANEPEESYCPSPGTQRFLVHFKDGSLEEGWFEKMECAKNGRQNKPECKKDELRFQVFKILYIHSHFLITVKSP